MGVLLCVLCCCLCVLISSNKDTSQIGLGPTPGLHLESVTRLKAPFPNTVTF